MILLGATAAFQIGRVPLNWDEDPVSKIGTCGGSGRLGLFRWEPLDHLYSSITKRSWIPIDWQANTCVSLVAVMKLVWRLGWLQSLLFFQHGIAIITTSITSPSNGRSSPQPLGTLLTLLFLESWHGWGVIGSTLASIRFGTVIYHLPQVLLLTLHNRCRQLFHPPHQAQVASCSRLRFLGIIISLKQSTCISIVHGGCRPNPGGNEENDGIWTWRLVNFLS